jgi:hypothetical protein
MQESSCELWVVIFLHQGWTNCALCAKLRVVPAMPRRPRKSASARPATSARRPPLKISAATRVSVEKILSAFSPGQVQRWARQTGFIQRRRQLKPFDFLSLMVFASWSMIAPSLEALAAELEGAFSRVALHYRFTRQASDFLWLCLQWVMAHGQQFQLVLQTRLLKPFSRVLIHDSSSWDLPPQLAGVFPGSGGSASPANCKVQLTYEVKRGRLQALQLTAGNRPDQSFRLQSLQAGDLILADLGFFSLRFFAAVVRQQAYFLSRFLIGTQLWSAPTGRLMDLPALLTKASGQAYQHAVLMGAGHRLACRLICLRVPALVVQQRRRRLRQTARKKGRTPSPVHLALCAWTLLATNAPERLLPAAKLYSLYRLRWQVELIFKQFKSVLRIHHCHTRRPQRLLCELYGKWIAAVLVHALHGSLNAELWNQHGQELSFDKLWKRIQQRALSLVKASLHPLHFTRCLLQQLPQLLRSCLKCRQPSRPTTLERLDIPEKLSIENFPI